MRLRQPIRIELPGSRGAVTVPTRVALPVHRLRGVAAMLANGIPLAMMAAGVTLALVAAGAAERPSTEGVGTMGVELGAALWFGGAVAFGVRRAPTLLRVLLIVLAGLTGAGLVVVALVRGWSGAGLALAMEFGVGAFAVAVIDVALLGVVHGRIDKLAGDSADSVLTIGIGRSWHLVDVRMERGEPLLAGHDVVPPQGLEP